MESTLHRQLKALYGPDGGGRAEVAVDGYRIDAIGVDGGLVEIQSGGLGRLRRKLERLVRDHPVRVVRPVPATTWIVRRARADGPDLGLRRSPRRGEPVDVFEDLVGLAGLLAEPNLRLDVLAVDVEEVRVPRRRRPGFAVVDRRLRSVRSTVALEGPDDLWRLLPADLPCPFTTRDLAERLGRPAWFAQKVAYCLRRSGAAPELGRSGRHRLYGRVGLNAAGR